MPWHNRGQAFVVPLCSRWPTGMSFWDGALDTYSRKSVIFAQILCASAANCPRNRTNGTERSEGEAENEEEDDRFPLWFRLRRVVDLPSRGRFGKAGQRAI